MCVDNPYTSKEYFQYGALIKSQTSQLGEILLQEEAEREHNNKLKAQAEKPVLYNLDGSRMSY